MSQTNTNELKLVVCDIDGTLVNEARDMMPLTKEALEALHAQGILFGIASGRQIDSKMFGYQDKWGLSFPFDVLIGMNGGQWYIREEGIIHENFKLSKETLKEIITMMERFDLNPYMYRGESMICKRMDVFMVESVRRNRIPSIVVPLEELYANDGFKVMYKIEEERMDEVVDFVSQQNSEDYVAIKTQPIMLEFQSPKINKGYALEKCCEALGISCANVLAYGDMENDLEMLKLSGQSVALKNGSELVKKSATRITAYSNDEDGVGRDLMDHVLSK